MNLPATLAAHSTSSQMIAAPSPAVCSKTPGWLDRQLRRRLLARLNRMEGESIRLVDADGVHLVGLHPVGDAGGSNAATIEVHQPRFYRRVATGGSLGAAESFVEAEWTSPDLVALLRAFARNIETLAAADGRRLHRGRWLARLAAVSHRNTRSGSRRNIAAHYDLGNEFFELFLDRTMLYSSACFDRPDTGLEEASLAKLERICRKLQLQSGDEVLEIGGGWGGFAEYAAREHGCRLTSTTISRKQFDYARRRIASAGLTDRVRLLNRDYRDLSGRFDKLVSIEMIEAVGHEYLDTYFRQCHGLLKSGGRMVIQAIVMPEQRYQRYRRSMDFIRKSIFPGGLLPSLAAIQEAVGRATNLRLVGVEDFTPSYARTLHLWRSRFLGRLDDVRRLGFSEEFIRTWDYYFSYCEAAFHERAVGLAQMEWVKVGQR